MADALIRAENVSVRFGDFTAVNNMSLHVDRGEIHALIGPNGAGKTTFFNAITGVRPATSGTIRFAGHDVTRMPAHRRVAYGMARSFQVTNIFPNLTVAENVRLAIQGRMQKESWVFWRNVDARQDIISEVNAILDIVRLTGRAKTLAGALSHGAQRSLEIGMALGAKPKFICLDEPLAGMSIDDIQETKDLILALKKDMGVLLIEHNMNVVLSISDRITVMAQGQKIAEGTPEDVRSDENVRVAYLGSKA